MLRHGKLLESFIARLVTVCYTYVVFILLYAKVKVRSTSVSDLVYPI